MESGLACPVCGQLNPLRSQACARCATALAPVAGTPVAAAAPAQPAPAYAQQPAAPALQYDPATGQPIQNPVAAQPASAPGAGSGPAPAAKTMFFGALQQENVTPRLVVIKGDGGGDGAVYHLSGTQHFVGRSSDCEISFAEDVFLSPRHAKFTVQDGRLFVQDDGSTNGIFARIKRPTPLNDNDSFLVGEQLLRLDARPVGEYAPNDAGTYFYGSPRPESAFRVIQELAGGGDGLVTSAVGNTLSIGRDANALNFPTDRFISGHHAQLDVQSDTGQVILTDTGSRNGTFVRITAACELHHGDYLFVGQQLFRIEIS